MLLLADAVLAQPVVERLRADAEHLGGTLALPAAVLEGVEDELARRHRERRAQGHRDDWRARVLGRDEGSGLHGLLLGGRPFQAIAPRHDEDAMDVVLE